MNSGQIPLLIICIYLALLLGLGVFANRLFRGTSQDYLLASHSIGPFLLLMSIFGTTMTAFALVGSTGEAFKEGIGVYGMLASSSGIIHSLCFFLVGIKLWSLGRKYGYTTQIQFFRDRLDSGGIGLLLFPILVGLVIPYLLIGVIAGGVVMQTMTSGAFPELVCDRKSCDERRIANLVGVAGDLPGGVDVRLFRRHAGNGLGKRFPDHGLHGLGVDHVLRDCHKAGRSRQVCWRT